MKAEDYVKDLRACSDADLDVDVTGNNVNALTYNCGVYDNFFVLVKESLLNTKLALMTNPFHYIHEGKNDVLFHYKPGVVELHLRNNEGLFVPSLGANHKSKPNVSKLLRNSFSLYPSVVSLHPYRHSAFSSDNSRELKEIPGMTWQRAMAHSIEDLIEVLQEREIPFCIPSSIGTKYSQVEERARKIVFSPNSIDDQIQIWINAVMTR